MAAPPILFQTGIHSARPAFDSGIVHYYCTTHNKLYQSDGTVWSDLYAFTSGTFTDPMTTRGDVIIRNASNTTARLGIGSSGKVLQSDGTDISWQTPSGLTDPMTTRGDVIVRNSSNVTARLAIGSSGKVLSSDGTDVSWQTPAAGFSDPMTTRGDIIVRNSSNVTARLGRGSAGTYLKSDGTDVSYVAIPNRSVQFVIDGGGSAITAGFKGDVEIPFGWTDIVRATLLADASGSIVVDVYKDTYANYPPTSGDKITASAPPTISSAVKSQDSTLTGWTKTGSAGDTLRFEVTGSPATIARVTLSLILVPA